MSSGDILDTPLPTRRLGRTSIDVAGLSLGCVTFGREIDQATSFQILDHATAAVINLLDPAEAYGGGHSREGRRLVRCCPIHVRTTF